MKTLVEMIEVMVGAKDGKTIEARPYRCSCCSPPKMCSWRRCDLSDWNWALWDYRVRPEPRRWKGHVTLDGGFISCDHANCTNESWVKVVEVVEEPAE